MADTPIAEHDVHEIATPRGALRYYDSGPDSGRVLLFLQRTIPHAELHIFPNSGHWAMIEAKKAFESTVLAFLSRTP